MPPMPPSGLLFLAALSLTASQKAPGCYLRDARFLLGPLERVTNPIQTVFDFFECQQLCEKTAGCTHFVYFGGSLFCNLGAGNLGVVEERGAVSGPAKCLEKESLACTGLPAGEFPAATPEASQRAWSTNYTPTRLQCWPLNSYSQPAYCRPHPVVSLENSSMGQCGDLQLVTPPEGQSCAQNCAGNVLCSTWQLREEGRCYQGLGIDCNAQLAVRDAGRLQHGLYRVIANLTGVQLSGLSPGHVGNGSQAVTRCRDLCLSLLACQAWQYSSTFGCYIDNPFVAPMPYPPVSQKETDFAKTAIAGQYVQRLCPEFVSRARGDSHDPDVVQQRNLPPVVAEIAEVSAPVLVAKPGTVAQAEEVATAKPTQLTTPAADVLPATLTVAPLLPAGVAVGTASSAAAATGTAASTPAAGMPAGSVAGTAASVPAGMAAGTAASTPGGMPASTPAGMPAGSAASTPAGMAAGAASTPAGTAAGSAAGMPAGSAASTPAGTAAGSAAGMPAGSAASTPAGTAAGSAAGTAPGTVAGTTASMPASTPAGTAAGSAAGTSAVMAPSVVVVEKGATTELPRVNPTLVPSPTIAPTAGAAPAAAVNQGAAATPTSAIPESASAAITPLPALPAVPLALPTASPTGPANALPSNPNAPATPATGFPTSLPGAMPATLPLPTVSPLPAAPLPGAGLPTAIRTPGIDVSSSRDVQFRARHNDETVALDQAADAENPKLASDWSSDLPSICLGLGGLVLTCVGAHFLRVRRGRGASGGRVCGDVSESDEAEASFIVK
ncbi:unnamed protein product [Effrenium voratum]|nr:unnamed protein product [Effrenium voratum]